MTSFGTGIISQLMFREVPETISRGEIELLREMIALDAADSDDQLTRFVPGGWWLGGEQVAAQICFRLLRHCFISMDGDESGGVSYWRVNEMGRMAVDGLSLAEIQEKVR